MRSEGVGAGPVPRRVCTVEEYAAELRALVSADVRADQVPLSEAVGRVAAEDVVSGVALPAFDNSAMDGYAVRRADLTETPAHLVVVGEVPAGSADDPAITPGACVRIMTGAPLPSDADAVVPVEDTDAGLSHVEIRVIPRVRAHVRGAGEDLRPGAVLCRAGTSLTPGHVGVLAAAGMRSVLVRPHPVVAVGATGDELVADGAPLGRGQIHESNSWALAASLERDGAQVLRGTPVPDDAEALVAWLDDRASRADLIVLTGGASVGAYDVVRDVLTAAGGTFRHVRMQPGKPQGWALWDDTPVIALPGNPVSSVISYEVLVAPVLDRRLGRASDRWIPAVAGAAWASPEGRRQFVPVVSSVTPAGVLEVSPAHERGSGSHLVSALAHADAVARVAEDVTAVAIGDRVDMRVLR